METSERLDFELQRVSLDLEQMAAMPPIGGKEMEVIAGDTEGA